MEPDLVAPLKMGRTIDRLADSRGANPDAKKSRRIARKAGLPYDGCQHEYTHAIKAYNAELYRCRGVSVSDAHGF